MLPKSFIRRTPHCYTKGRERAREVLLKLFDGRTGVAGTSAAFCALLPGTDPKAVSHLCRLIEKVKGVRHHKQGPGGYYTLTDDLRKELFPDKEIQPQPEQLELDLAGMSMRAFSPTALIDWDKTPELAPEPPEQDQTPLEVLAARTFYEGAIASYCQAHPEAALFFNNIRQRADKLFAGT